MKYTIVLLILAAMTFSMGVWMLIDWKRSFGSYENFPWHTVALEVLVCVLCLWTAISRVIK